MKGLLLCVAVAASSYSLAASVYVMSSGNSAMDDEVVFKLQAYGHVAIIGAPWYSHLDSAAYSSFDAVYVQPNYNWNGGVWTPSGQSALAAYVQNGGGLVTTEWMIYNIGINRAGYETLFNLMPSTYGSAWRSIGTMTYVRVTPDPTINAGLPDPFGFEASNVAGSESYLVPKPQATEFYRSDYLMNSDYGAGVVGWSYGSGRVLNFSTVNGLSQLQTAAYGRLVSNAVFWVADGASAGANLIATLDFHSYAGPRELPNPVRFDFYIAGTTTLVSTRNISANPGGTYTVPSPGSGPYDIVAEAGTWLRHKVTNIALATEQGRTFSLTNGDCDHDNDVDIDDYDILAGAYGSFEGGAGYVANADLDYDGDVDIDDYDILAGSYGSFGD